MTRPKRRISAAELCRVNTNRLREMKGPAADFGDCLIRVLDGGSSSGEETGLR
jgi:hypothetical protein